jgi:dTDP-4-dehydrorhamnose 3,5-epimerase
MRGVSLIESFQSSDSRGSFLKILKYEELLTIPEFELEEVFFSTSLQGAIRGMHLQVNEASNWRFIQVLHGKAFDVLLDLRRSETTFLDTQINLLSEESHQTLIVPPGVAHGFQALTDIEMIYLTSHRYEPDLDKGVSPFSIGIEWPLEVTSISERDSQLPTLQDYIK